MPELEHKKAAESLVARLMEPCAHCETRHLSVCRAIEDPYIDQLAQLVTTIDLSPRGSMIAEGEAAGHYFNITTGAIKVFKLLPDGRQQIIGFSLPGDFIGLAVKDAYGYSAEALIPSRVCRFDRNKLEGLLVKFPKMEHELRNQASDELAIAQDQMMLLGRKTAKERVASFLLQLSVRAKRAGLGHNPIHLSMGRADIADFLGLTIETVSRTFTSLKKDGMIELEPGNHVRLRTARLQELSGDWY
jgi:CRP/FNR family transcriptional regulator